MTTPENQPPTWATPDYPQKPPYQGGTTPGGYPPPSYPSQPPAYPPSQPQAYPPPQPPAYPPAQPQPRYPSQPPAYPPSSPGTYQGGTYQGGTYQGGGAATQQGGGYQGGGYQGGGYQGGYQGGAGPGTYPPPPQPPSGFDPLGPSQPAKKSGLSAKLLSGLGVVLLILVALAVKVGPGLISDLGGSGGGGGGGPSITDPFEGTVAADYPNGEAGIVLPAATEVPGFTAEEVAAALETVRQALILGRLDENMLVNHDRTALRALFSPLGAEELDTWFDEKLGGIFATMIAPGYELRDEPIKVKGTITFAGTIIDGITMLEVNTKFVWVYAFTGELEEAGDHLVTLNDDLYLVFPVPSEVVAEAVGMFPDSRSTSFAYNIDCALLDQDLIALGTPQYTIDGGPDVDQDDVMDPNNPADFADTC